MGPPMKASFRMALIVSLALAAGALMVAGCGGDDKPDYCSNVSDLQQSVDDLKSVHLEKRRPLHPADGPRRCRATQTRS